MTITEFLLAKIAEDEDLANATIADQQKRGWGDWREESLAEGGGLPAGDLTAAFSPARVLAECAAKRAIIADRKRMDRSAGMDDWYAGYSDANYDALHALAAVYASHPDYRQDWAQ